MTQFVAFDKGVEVNGETVLSVVCGMGALRERALAILREKGIVEPQAGRWYPQQAWLNAFESIAQLTGSSVLWTIGKKIPECAQFPPQIKTIDDALMAIDVAYHAKHRGGEIGRYVMDRGGDRLRIMVCENPYPCDFDRGLIEAMAKRFKPSDVPSVKVEHSDQGGCRKSGGKSCTYLVKW